MVTMVKDGLYRKVGEESPREVAEKVYGDGSRYHILLKFNDDWDSQEIVTIPNKEGRTTIVTESDNLKSLIKRMFPNQPVHLYETRFLIWNGCLLPEDLVGETVFIPER